MNDNLFIESLSQSQTQTHYRRLNIIANVMLETTFFSTVQIKGIIKFADKSLRHDLHNAIVHFGISPAAWSS